MNDLEFAQRVSARIGELYSEAKRSRYQFPKHALIQARAIASLCCDLLRPDDWREWPDGLDEKIRMLAKAQHINRDTHEKLNDLRRWGNAAAHPEESRREEAQFGLLASEALTNAIILLETVFRQKHGGAALPDYVVVEESPDELKEVCYRALVENSPADQYQVAILLRQQLVSKVKDTEVGPDPFMASYIRRFEFSALEGRTLDLLRYASDASYPPASYQYGLALSEGERGDEYVAFGVNLIAMAARDGDIDALAWCGHSAMHGLHDEPVDYERARVYLEKAAAEDQPLALSLLSRMYRKGLGVAVDPKVAFDLTLRAAEAGYPVAQYEVGAALYQGEGVEVNQPAAIAWLQQASDAGLPEAQQVVGNLMRRGVLPGGFAEVAKLLTNAIRGVNEASLDLADLYISQAEPRQWINASGLVQNAYERALAEKDELIADRALRLAPTLVSKLEELSTRMSDQEHKDFLVARFMFDEHGRPFPKRAERVQEFADAVLALAKVKGSGSKEEARLVRKLAPGMGATSASAPVPALVPATRRTRALASVVRRVARTKVGRNEPCPCGSGQKFKACCG
jgi:TPR repeat protein